jgi:hypothetical protein
VRIVKAVLGQWNHFWFESDGVQQAQLFRFVFGLTLFLLYLARTPDLTLFYSDSGIMKMRFFPELLEMPFRYTVLDHFTGTSALWGFHITFLVSLLSMAVGFFPRISALLAFGLHLSFLRRNLGIVYGVDSLATYFLGYLCLVPYGLKRPFLFSFRSQLTQVFSFFRIQPKAARKSSGEKSDSRSWSYLRTTTVGSAAFRLAQIQVCIIYAYSGFHKLRGAEWWQGNAIWDVLANFQIARMDFSWASAFPSVLVAATYITILWEFYFPVLIWVGKCRRTILVLGVMIHLGIGFTMNIPFFGALMICTYTLFLTQDDFVTLGAFFSKIFTAKSVKN